MNTNLNDFDFTLVNSTRSEKNTSMYAYISKNSIVIHGIEAYGMDNVSVGYNEKNDTIAIVDSKYAPDYAEKRKLSIVNHKASTRKVYISSLIDYFKEHHKSYKQGYQNRFEITWDGGILLLHLNRPISKR